MVHNFYWLLVVMSVLYGFIVTMFGSKIFFDSLQKMLMKRKLNPLFFILFLFSISGFLFLPVLIDVKYWIFTICSSFLTTFVLLLFFRQNVYKENKGKCK